MKCCEVPPGEFGEVAEGPGIDLLIDRRSALRGLAGAVGGAAVLASGLAQAADKRLKLAFCGQLLCVVPYEVTRARGHFKAEGLDVELVYTRGGSQAMQALVGGAVDYAGTSFDVALLAYAKGAKIKRFASTGRLPLFALATAPKVAKEIKSLKDLEGHTVAVSALGNADHSLLLYLLVRAGADPTRVRFAALGTNLYDALRLGQVDAGMVQEPALSLVTAAGGGVLVNMMELKDADRYVGGAYEFMGVSVRADESDARLDEMRRLARALAKGLADTRTIPGEDVVVALPKELVAGGDRPQLLKILERYRASLYPESVKIDTAAVDRVIESQKAAGVLKAPVDLAGLLDTSVVGG
jgi:NitT/TauT family transport system substrate-binding protein